MTEQIQLELDPSDAEEVFEILCEIPFEQPSLEDSEPPQCRQHGIEALISQLQKVVYDETDEDFVED
jgi:hypothetical protein